MNKHSVETKLIQTKRLLRPCFICDSDQGINLYEQSFVLEDNHPLPKSYSVVACKKCANVFADTAATQADYDYFYEEFSKYENESISPGSALSSWDSQRLEKTANQILEKIGSEKLVSVLDIGSAQGGLLNILKKNGLHNLAALEPSSKCCQIIEEKSENQITSFSGSISGNLANSFDSKKFDVIILSQVLEHILDVKQAIKNLKQLMTPTSLLYVEVPDASRYADFFKTPFHFFDVEHINHFTKTSLISLFCMNEFELLDFGAKNIEVGYQDLYPAIYGFFRNTSPIEDLRTYIEKSEDIRNSINFDEYEKTQTPLAVWGMGSYAKQLLANTRLSRCNVVHFIDGNSKKWGSRIGGSEVKDPEILKDFKGIILITSAIYEESIKKQIKNMGLNNQINVIK